MPFIHKWLWLIVMIFIILIIYLIWPKSDYEVVIPTSDDNLDQEESIHDQEELQTIFVDVKGEVNLPGVYEMPEGKRVKDVIDLAGGFTEDADQYQVNLAMILQDEMVIFVPSINSETTEHTSSPITNSEGKIRINSATKEELETIPGIGETKALSIIQYREEHGPFKQSEDLLNISGIGEKTLEKIVEFIVVP
ncbi:helix-hairpin-helix domain-containing protein [Aquisalibacillus elongatus]|uniref:Competence protein ComEA n=1 Tax=Aquisalibacillus elongatus TaxID=485577 RepID=A0A3N5C0I0_9BACI|nr:helix-hairpin-helix domain-containing protein [Aquisalibacillus elongatus]RPF55568.1 competence protein ComEA [Aquisalibacillus elongatus]